MNISPQHERFSLGKNVEDEHLSSIREILLGKDISDEHLSSTYERFSFGFGAIG
jgi:hypothetical protein